MKKIIIVSDVNYAYDVKNILKGVNFDVDQGSFFIIIGPNGSGKTTLIRLIAGMETVNNGVVKIMGMPLYNYTKKKLSQILAYVPQNMSIDFPFTVYEVVCTGRSPHLGLLGILSTSDKKIVMDSMKFTGVDKLANREINQLSGGERQRVFIARAICQQPTIIILDEPTASLDITHQVKIMDLMEKLIKERNVTVVMVSHDINLASIYSDKILLIKSGSIIKTGLPKEVLKFQLLEAAYECSIFLDISPFNETPRITPIPSRYR